MIYGSVCSGVESASLAWEPLGWKPAFFSEIEKMPRAVLRHHWPNVPLHGDFRKITRKDIRDVGSIDLLVGGTPCQDFSVAGLRKGLAGDRGTLTIEFVRLAKRLRPQWLVWENVPGVLSADKGEAFGIFLRALGECGYGFAYRVLDAQHYGVPQRRRRVFVVGYFGDWRPPAAVLFERESLSGDSAPRQKSGEDVAGTITSRTSGGGDGPEQGYGANLGFLQVLAPTLDARSGRSGENSFATSGGLVSHTLRGEGHDASEDGTGRGIPLVIGPTVSSKWAKGTGGPSGDECYNLVTFDSKGTQVETRSDGIAPTLRSMGANAGNANGHGQLAIAISMRGREGGAMAETSGEVMPALRASQGGGDKAFALDLRNALRDPEKHDAINRQGTGIGDDIAHTLSAAQSHGVSHSAAVRRLTPRECERLQGMPDDHTLVPIDESYDRKRKKKIRMMSDAARYRMCGNAMAIPPMQRIGERINMVNKLLGVK